MASTSTLIGVSNEVCTTSFVTIGGRLVSGRGTTVIVIVALERRRLGSWIV